MEEQKLDDNQELDGGIVQIKTTSFDLNDYGSSKYYSSVHGGHVYHNIDVFNEIIINDHRLSVVYQTGKEYIGGDYNRPSNELKLSVD